MPNEIRYPKLQIAVVIEDSVTGRKCLSSVSLTPEQLEAFKVGAISAATKALVLGMVVSPEFMEFMGVADAIWRNLLFELPQGQRGSSATVHPLARKHGDRPMPADCKLYHMLAARFGRPTFKQSDNREIPTNDLSTVVCAVTAFGAKLGEIVAIADICDFPPKILEVLTDVVPDAVAAEIDYQLWNGDLPLPEKGKKYGVNDVKLPLKLRTVNKPVATKSAAKQITLPPVPAVQPPTIAVPLAGGER